MTPPNARSRLPLWVRLSLYGARTRKEQRTFLVVSLVLGVLAAYWWIRTADVVWVAMSSMFFLGALRTVTVIRWMDVRGNWE